MTRTETWVVVGWLCSVSGTLVSLPVSSAAQEPTTDSTPAAPADRAGAGRGRLPRRGAAAGNPEMMTIQQVEEYFDQVMLHQARTNLALSDDQFLRFGAGLRRLQTARRQEQRRRLALVRELNGLANATPFDESAVTAKLKELDDFSAQSTGEIRSAYDVIDRVLTLRQRARFRVFEEMMERRKLDLISRARQLVPRSDAPAK